MYGGARRCTEPSGIYMESKAYSSLDAAVTLPCRFCGIAEGHFERTYDAPLAASQDYFALASVGALVPGWVLICPKAHIPNLSTLYRDPQLVALRLKIADVLRRRLQLPVRMFEHGPSCAGSATGCGVNHAHLHLVPLTQPLVLGISRLDERLVWHTTRASTVRKEVGSHEYLFYSDDAHDADPLGAVAVLEAPVSQYFRKVIAKQICRANEFDYRTHPNLHNVSATASVFAACTKP